MTAIHYSCSCCGCIVIFTATITRRSVDVAVVVTSSSGGCASSSSIDLLSVFRLYAVLLCTMMMMTMMIVHYYVCRTHSFPFRFFLGGGDVFRSLLAIDYVNYRGSQLLESRKFLRRWRRILFLLIF